MHYYKGKGNSDEESPQSQTNPMYDPKVSFFNSPAVDIYSLGFLFWELEYSSKPFDNENAAEVFDLLTINKVRPRITAETNRSLALLIRRCW